MLHEKFGLKWFMEAQLYRPALMDDLLETRDAQRVVDGPIAVPSAWRYAEGGLWVPKGRLVQSPNLIIDDAQEELLKAWSYISGSVLKIKTFSLGTSYATPARTDTDMGTLLEEKDIESWDDTLLPPDSSNTSIRKAICLWLSTEANGDISEGGLKFDDGSLVTHANWTKLAIGNITQASEAVVTFGSAHGLATGDEIHIDNVVGMTEVNDLEFTVTVVDSDEVSLDGINSTGYGAYTSGSGDAWQIVTKSTGEVLETRYGLSITS